MPRKMTDPIGCVPTSTAVEKALEEARRRVTTLEYLLEISRGIECRMKGETTARGLLGGQSVVACER